VQSLNFELCALNFDNRFLSKTDGAAKRLIPIIDKEDSLGQEVSPTHSNVDG